MKADVIKYFSDTNTRWGTYHNHKENMAWAVVVLYYVFALKFVEVLHSYELETVFENLMATVVLVIISAITWHILAEQHYLRVIAADVYSACTRIAVKCLAMDPTEVDGLDLSLVPPPWKLAGQAPATLPNCLALEYLAIAGGGGRKSRISLERLSYMLVGLATIVAFGAIWAHDIADLAKGCLNQV